MGQYTRNLNKFEYFVEDCDCRMCLFWRGKKKGCVLDTCCCAEIRRDALAQGRIKRKPGSMR